MSEVRQFVATQVNTCDELLLTELVFEGVFEDLTPAETAAALSALILQRRGAKDEPTLTPALKVAQRRMLQVAAGLEALHKECGVMDAAAVDDDDPTGQGGAAVGSGASENLEALTTTKQLNFALMEVVHEWACGLPFLKVSPPPCHRHRATTAEPALPHGVEPVWHADGASLTPAAPTHTAPPSQRSVRVESHSALIHPSSHSTLIQPKG